MEKTKRYYWIKLKTDFFNLAEIDFLYIIGKIDF